MTYEAELAAFAAAIDQDIARLLMAASSAVNARALASLDPDGTSGVRVAHVPVIASLDPHGSRVADLAARIGHTRQSVAALVRDLERAGVVMLEPDPTDRRATLVTLTADGAALCARATEMMRAAEHAWRDEFGDATVDSLRATLRRLATDGADSPG
jgi:DNA-binding MarR family transcriptional regulator